ncbi:hypothetical protein LOZ80_08525 [Paenibacillus sp. HWE-109]|uniref:hypothetical protein n=1 Tax=Paenibacillus sp. HWE-109 TaxID=1306526 RepID=UPI001EDCEFB9|nr:hypothetical protein [Paenibacillus sp. HWE-109]UKS28955.1 hypothetical protein LOZ80_08525 [Paenibacillus sp. HWE-109]
MIASITLLACLLSACSHPLTVTDSAAIKAAPSPTAGHTSPEDRPNEDVQNLTEMRLVMLFQALLRMDRNASLTISAKQAVAMLPYIRESMEEGSMNDTERKQVLGSLTSEQRTFLDEQSKQVNKRIKERVDKPHAELSQEEREKRINAFIEQRKAERAVEAGQIDRVDGGTQQLDPRSMGKSIEQQLVELLVSKQD